MLVGGQGTRLRPLTLSAPKPMLPTAGVPFLTHLFSRVKAAGVRRVVGRMRDLLAEGGEAVQARALAA